MRETIRNNSKLFLLAVTAIFVIALVWMALGTRRTITQPISYNHKLHIEEVELNCIDCHIYVENMPSATIPNTKFCMDCHADEPMSDSPEEVKLLKYIKEGQSIPWQKIYSVPDHVYFSHRRHVTIGEIDCSECHGNVQELTEPAPYPIWVPTMNNCINCHKENKVTYDCLTCHR